MAYDFFNVFEVEPEEHGYEVCDHCNGYGSCLKEDSDRCTKCGGKGLVKTKAQPCLFCNAVGKHEHDCEILESAK